MDVATAFKSGGDSKDEIKTYEKYSFTSNFAIELDILKLDVYVTFPFKSFN